MMEKIKSWVSWVLGFLAGLSASVKIFKAREKAREEKEKKRIEKAVANEQARKESIFAKWNRRRRERGLPERKPFKLVSKTRGDSPPNPK